MNLKEIRIAKGMTQKELANAIEVTDAAICQYENGQREPNLDNLKKLARVLDCTVDELINDPKEEQK